MVGEEQNDLVRFEEYNVSVTYLENYINALPKEDRMDFTFRHPDHDDFGVQMSVLRGPFDSKEIADGYRDGYYDAMCQYECNHDSDHDVIVLAIDDE